MLSLLNTSKAVLQGVIKPTPSICGPFSQETEVRATTAKPGPEHSVVRRDLISDSTNLSGKIISKGSELLDEDGDVIGRADDDLLHLRILLDGDEGSESDSTRDGKDPYVPEIAARDSTQGSEPVQVDILLDTKDLLKGLGLDSIPVVVRSSEAAAKSGIKISDTISTRGLEEDKREAMDTPPEARGVLDPPLKPRMIIFKDILSGDESRVDKYVLKGIDVVVESATDSLDNVIGGDNADIGIEKRQIMAIVNGGGGLGSLAQQYTKALGLPGAVNGAPGFLDNISGGDVGQDGIEKRANKDWKQANDKRELKAPEVDDGGVKRLIYDETRGLLKPFLESIVNGLSSSGTIPR